MTTDQDVRTLLGMHTAGAKVVVVVYVVAILISAVGNLNGVTTVWPVFLAVALIAAGLVALIAAPGDPLPRSTTLALAAIGPVSCALVLWVLPSPMATPLQGWTHGAAATILCFMCVRGRRISPWLSLIAMIITYGAWGALNNTGFGAQASKVVIDATPLAMATILSFTLRPTAKAVFTLRARSERQIEEQAALAAAVAERTEQRNRLDRLARPLLTRIASDVPLTVHERLSCELLEAHLRDHLRAPALSTPLVDDAAFEARRRGVDVILIDDGGMDDASPDVSRRVKKLVADALSSAESGAVRVRVLPPGRDSVASIYIDDGLPRRITIDRHGVDSDST
ncbi:hypothetical protein ACNHUS_18565 [Actinomycetes bacterium M1A6_2h]